MAWVGEEVAGEGEGVAWKRRGVAWEGWLGSDVWYGWHDVDGGLLLNAKAYGLVRNGRVG